ncbi:MAG: acetyl-CoA hydrolase/transferase C-terminal domain-containing protein [Firmicutes bacterium]|nr:acetyl-CoA hydrolase/transferase C-terminal domain-containing protein [Bacillota bacterium]
MYNIKQVQSEYRSKMISAEFAANLVKSNYRIHFGLGTNTSVYMDRALGERLKDDTLLRGLEVMTQIAIRKDFMETYKATTSVDQCRFYSAHFGADDRQMQKEGNSWFIPMLFNEEPLYWAQEGNGFDICCFQVAPMDKYGNFNFGPVNADLWGIIKNSKTVIVEVNESMPIALGYDSHINISEVSYIIEGDNPMLPEMPPKPATEEDKRIAEFIVGKVNNFSVLQLGIGAVPNSVGSMLADSDIRDLSAHSEMFVDACVDLYNAGKLTNRKPRDKGLSVYTFAGGSQRVYDFIDDNPICCSAPVDYVNNISTIASFDNFISINGCIGIDLYGQVCSESVGYRHISGTGGQLDFVLGAFLSNGGKSFICTKSSRVGKDGKRSSLIHPILPAGSIVSTPRAAVNYVVTEFGGVNLKGKSTWQRAEQLISIAHPECREELIKEAEKMGIWRRTSKVEYL